MQEINLLDSRLKDTTHIWEKRTRLFITLVTLVVFLESGLYGVFLLLTNNIDQQINTLTVENNNIQADINRNQEDLIGARAFQAQLQNVRAILDSHIYWTGFFDELSDFTFNAVTFNSLQSGENRKIHLEGQVNSYTDLGKLILGLEQSGQFENIELLSVNASSGLETGFVFSLDLVANSNLFVKQN